MRPVALLALVALVGCATAPQGQPEILALGDSVMAWNRVTGGDIPSVIGRQLGQPVLSKAVSGAEMMGGANAIQSQYVPGNWDWVVIDGGANDLRNTCGCNQCDAVLDQLISANGQSGAIPDLARKAATGPTRVLLMGYYGTSIAGGSFAACADELDILADRMTRLATSEDDILFVSSKPAIDTTDLGDYFLDHVHPSRRGSEKIGTLLAQAMAASAP